MGPKRGNIVEVTFKGAYGDQSLRYLFHGTLKASAYEPIIVTP